MSERLEYLIKDNECEEAIDEFKKLHSVPDWLSQYSELYYSITLQPEGRPRIVSCNYGGETFENIRLFGRLYDLVNSLFQ